MQKTCLNEEHRKLNAKLIDFGGWEMPVQYSGILTEHEAVREDVGICDASHMGQVYIRGNDARAFVNYLITNDISNKEPGQATYTLMCNHSGGVIDDLIVCVRDDQEILLVVNASRRKEDLTWMSGVLAQSGFKDARIEPDFDGRGLIAVQGPKAEKHLQEHSDSSLADLKSFRFREGALLGRECIISRTGYTGEDGFEVMSDADHIVALWQALIDGGATPTGLGSRDTLRQEMGFPLYGNDLDAVTTPLEAGLKWAVKLGKDDFVGKAALEHQLEHGPEVNRVGISSNDRGIPRHGCQVYLDNHRVGYVSSGCFSPSLKQGIGQAFIDPELTKPGTVVEVEIRNRRHKATVTRMPFLQRGGR